MSLERGIEFVMANEVGFNCVNAQEICVNAFKIGPKTFSISIKKKKKKFRIEEPMLVQ